MAILSTKKFLILSLDYRCLAYILSVVLVCLMPRHLIHSVISRSPLQVHCFKRYSDSLLPAAFLCQRLLVSRRIEGSIYIMLEVSSYAVFSTDVASASSPNTNLQTPSHPTHSINDVMMQLSSVTELPTDGHLQLKDGTSKTLRVHTASLP